MKLRDSSKQALLGYVCRQVENFFPDDKAAVKSVLAKDMDESLARLNTCINAVKMWQPNEFYYLHTEQYTLFLYFLANTVWRNRKNENICNKLFYLNKALNGFSCFYDVELPDIFFVGHSGGIVLANATYANYFAVYQNCTVGKNHGRAPVLGEGVVMYPGSAVIGGVRVGKGTVVSQGASIINQDTPGDCLVFKGSGNKLIFKKSKRDILQDIFRV